MKLDIKNKSTLTSRKMTSSCAHTQIDQNKNKNNKKKTKSKLNWNNYVFLSFLQKQKERKIYFSKLTFVYLSTEVDAGLGTHTCTHKHPRAHLSCVPQIKHIWTETHRSNHHHLIYLHCIFLCLYAVSVLSCSLSSSHVCSMFVVRSSSTMGCRSSSHSRCLLLSSRSRNKEEMDGQKRREGRKGGFGGSEGQKQGKKEKPKREKTKNIATGCWVTLESV